MRNSEKKKKGFFGDFDIEVFNHYQPTNEFFDLFASNSFIPYNVQTTTLLIIQNSSLTFYNPL